MLRCLVMKIGVFDSGIGGQAVAEELRRLIPAALVVSINDHANVPYGGRPQAEIIQLTKTAIQPLLDGSYDAIVIACNTATTNAIHQLRQDNSDQKFVGLEPMIKPAALLTKSGKIAVLATPATLQSSRYATLKEKFAEDITVFEPDCSTWAALIENGQMTSILLEETIQPLLKQNVDVIVLGCTHYHWLKQGIQKIVGPGVTVLEPSEAIKNRIVEITNYAQQ